MKRIIFILLLPAIFADEMAGQRVVTSDMPPGQSIHLIPPPPPPTPNLRFFYDIDIVMNSDMERFIHLYNKSPMYKGLANRSLEMRDFHYSMRVRKGFRVPPPLTSQSFAGQMNLSSFGHRVHTYLLEECALYPSLANCLRDRPEFRRLRNIRQIEPSWQVGESQIEEIAGMLSPQYDTAGNLIPVQISSEPTYNAPSFPTRARPLAVYVDGNPMLEGWEYLETLPASDVMVTKLVGNCVVAFTTRFARRFWYAGKRISITIPRC